MEKTTRTIYVQLRPRVGTLGLDEAIQLATAFGGSVDRVPARFDFGLLRFVPAHILVSIPYTSNAQYLSVQEAVSKNRMMTFRPHTNEVQLYVNGERYIGPPLDDEPA